MVKIVRDSLFGIGAALGLVLATWMWFGPDPEYVPYQNAIAHDCRVAFERQIAKPSPDTNLTFEMIWCPAVTCHNDPITQRPECKE